MDVATLNLSYFVVMLGSIGLSLDSLLKTRRKYSLLDGCVYLAFGIYFFNKFLWSL